jgi:hypothetical protein
MQRCSALSATLSSPQALDGSSPTFRSVAAEARARVNARVGVGVRVRVERVCGEGGHEVGVLAAALLPRCIFASILPAEQRCQPPQADHTL